MKDWNIECENMLKKIKSEDPRFPELRIVSYKKYNKKGLVNSLSEVILANGSSDDAPTRTIVVNAFMKGKIPFRHGGNAPKGLDKFVNWEDQCNERLADLKKVEEWSRLEIEGYKDRNSENQIISNSRILLYLSNDPQNVRGCRVRNFVKQGTNPFNKGQSRSNSQIASSTYKQKCYDVVNSLKGSRSDSGNNFANMKILMFEDTDGNTISASSMSSTISRKSTAVLECDGVVAKIKVASLMEGSNPFLITNWKEGCEKRVEELKAMRNERTGSHMWKTLRILDYSKYGRNNQINSNSIIKLALDVPSGCTDASGIDDCNGAQETLIRSIVVFSFVHDGHNPFNRGGRKLPSDFTSSSSSGSDLNINTNSGTAISAPPADTVIPVLPATALSDQQKKKRKHNDSNDNLDSVAVWVADNPNDTNGGDNGDNDGRAVINQIVPVTTVAIPNPKKRSKKDKREKGKTDKK